MQFFIFVFFVISAALAYLASPIDFFKRNRDSDRGEIILLTDLHRTTFRRH